MSPCFPQQEAKRTVIPEQHMLHEEGPTHVSNALAREHEEVKALIKSNIELETKISDLEKQLLLEQHQRQEIECSKHKIDTEVTDLKDQLNECRLQITELQCQLVKSKEELTQANIKADEEGAGKAECQKALSELKSQLAELQKEIKQLEELSAELSRELVHEQRKSRELENVVTDQTTKISEVKEEEQHTLSELKSLTKQLYECCEWTKLQLKVLEPEEALSLPVDKDNFDSLLAEGHVKLDNQHEQLGRDAQGSQANQVSQDDAWLPRVSPASQPAASTAWLPPSPSSTVTNYEKDSASFVEALTTVTGGDLSATSAGISGITYGEALANTPQQGQGATVAGVPVGTPSFEPDASPTINPRSAGSAPEEAEAINRDQIPGLVVEEILHNETKTEKNRNKRRRYKLNKKIKKALVWRDLNPSTPSDVHSTPSAGASCSSQFE